MTLQELMDRNYEQGLEQGRTEGESAATLKLVHSMKANNIDVKLICDMTGLSPEEIEKI